LNSTCVLPWHSCAEGVAAGAFAFQTAEQQIYVPTNDSRQVNATCTVDGDSIWTNVACTELNQEELCTEHSSPEAENTCSDYGMEVTPFRSQAHYKSLVSRWDGPTWFTTAGYVINDDDNCGGCTFTAMNSGQPGQR
jgi:hypothetical protein